jgi:hypothetical protein
MTGKTKQVAAHAEDPSPRAALVWSNPEGTCPWQPGGDDLLGHQPRLDLHPEEHPAGVWTQDLRPVGRFPSRTRTP